MSWFRTLAACAALATLWLAPVSPMAMSRADVALGKGDPVTAAARYDQVARWTPFASTRAEALRRSAGVHASELNNPTGARERLLRLLDQPLPDTERADLLASVGRMWRRERRPAKAAQAFQASIEADPDAVNAARRMELAARSFTEAGMSKKAQQQWRTLLEAHSPWRGRANLGLAELHLASRQIPRALELFEDVAEHGTPDEQAAARLGISVCLEKLGDLDSALAAIDGAELPESVRRSRTNALRARQLWVPLH